MEDIYRKREREFLDAAATTVSFPGGKVQAGRFIPDAGYTLESGPDGKSVMLKDNNGNPCGGLTCECALEGGGCHLIIVNGGEIGEHAACFPDERCGTSGLFCFMGFSQPGGFTIRFRV
jgi:hypothetical protein